MESRQLGEVGAYRSMVSNDDYLVGLCSSQLGQILSIKVRLSRHFLNHSVSATVFPISLYHYSPLTITLTHNGGRARFLFKPSYPGGCPYNRRS